MKLSPKITTPTDSIMDTAVATIHKFRTPTIRPRKSGARPMPSRRGYGSSISTGRTTTSRGGGKPVVVSKARIALDGEIKTHPLARKVSSKPLLDILLKLLACEAYQDKTRAPGKEAVVGHAVVARCLEYIGTHRQQRVRLTDLDRISGFSRRGLIKAFIRHLGCGPGAVIRAVRIMDACELLVRTSLTLDKVAKCCGYRNANSLCVAFARDMDITPSDFRRRFQRHR